MSTALLDIPHNLVRLAPNVGGVGAPEDLVGRDDELERLHQSLPAGGAHVLGERRSGKTWVIKRLAADLADSVTAVYVSAEFTPERFPDRLLAALRQNHLVRRSLARWDKRIGAHLRLALGKSEFGMDGTLAQPADQRSKATVDVLDMLSCSGDAPVVLIIDEITTLCRHLGRDRAHQLLTDLQASPSPVVIAGSIGLHHAVDDLEPIAKLWPVEVGPLPPPDAGTLAVRLLLGIDQEPTANLVADIVRETSAFPYYMHGAVEMMRTHPGVSASAIMDEGISTNRWHTEHLITRLTTYYGRKDARRAQAILDRVVAAPGLVDPEWLGWLLAADHPNLAMSHDALLDLLVKLQKDHYLVREGDLVRISSPLLARIWRHYRWTS